MDADYVPSKEKRKKTSKENRRNSKFAKAVTEKKPVFNPGRFSSTIYKLFLRGKASLEIMLQVTDSGIFY